MDWGVAESPLLPLWLMSETAGSSTSCPRCGQADVSGPTCPRCGVVLAKARAGRPRPVPLPAADERPRSSAVHWLLLLAVVAAGGSLALLARRGPAPAASRPAAIADGETAGSRVSAAAIDVPPPQLPPAAMVAPAEVMAPPPAAGLPPEDHEKASGLSARIRSGTRLAAADIDAAEDLFSRYPAEGALRELLQAALVTAALQEHSRRDYSQAAAHLQRAVVVQPDSTRPRLALLQVAIDASDWPGAEAAARAVLQIDPRDTSALYGLGYALFRLDRNREAADTLRASLDIKEDSNTRVLLDRIQKSLADERGMTEQRLSHFNVRYDGAAHEDVGREILRVLERHYATLARALDYEPVTTIPVILFSEQGYYDANGAPAWSGGNFDQIDGRIRIPIGGLTTSLTPDIENVVLHELTHAFVHERTRGVCPRLVHEGIAQYMEGKRLDTELTPQMAAAVADRNIGQVYAFYLGALSFVEYLITNRGMGGMNDLLRVMGETGDVNAAFRQVHGQTFNEALKGWQERIGRRYGA
jgi:tetratricopeptide (TPR) repeat protein